MLMQSATEMTPGHQIQLGPPHHILDTKMGLELGLDAREPASFLGCIPYLAYWDRFVKGYDAKETHKLALVRAQSHAGLLAQGVNLIHLEVVDAPCLIIVAIWAAHVIEKEPQLRLDRVTPALYEGGWQIVEFDGYLSLAHGGRLHDPWKSVTS